MATINLVDSNMVLTFDAGVDGEGNPVKKRKSFNSVKTTATADQLYAIAAAITPLQQLPVLSIERDDSTVIAG